MVDVGTHVRNGSLAAPDDDWPTQAADTIERVVGSVREKTTGPALTASRALVYGTFAVIVGMAALVLVVIAAVRLLDSYLPDAVFGETHTWAAHLITGLVFTIAGLFAWSKRSAARTEETDAG
jgi:hypothetical protein